MTRMGVTMQSNELVPERFFSLRKIWWTIVYDLMLVGFLACWVFIRVAVFGGEVSIPPIHEYIHETE